jgi:hypothetical protein
VENPINKTWRPKDPFELFKKEINDLLVDYQTLGTDSMDYRSLYVLIVEKNDE